MGRNRYVGERTQRTVRTAGRVLEQALDATAVYSTRLARATRVAARAFQQAFSEERPEPPTITQRPRTQPTATTEAAEITTAPVTDTAEGPTKQELYERAKELEIEGRSRMSKEELQQAVAAAERT